MIVKLITFGDGSTNYHEAVVRLLKQSESFSSINIREGFSSDNLNSEYHNLFPNFAEKYPRGYGNYSWKPFLISAELRKLKEGDILVYLDAGCELSAEGEERFQFYLSQTTKNDVTLFELPHPNRFYTKNDPKFFENPEHYLRNQIVAGVIFLKKSVKSTNFVDDWLALCTYEGGRLLVDPSQSETQIPGFVAHRHDQSCLSSCAFYHNIKTLPDETWFENFQGKEKYPILALRSRSGKSKIKRKLKRKKWKLF